MRYAVVFTCYKWDAFHLRQLERIASRAVGADIFVVVDETNGTVGPIPWDCVIRTSVDDMRVRNGLEVFIERGAWKEDERFMFWWNLDCLTWIFYEANQEYDYCISMDYDASINMDVDALMRRVVERKLDFVGHSHVDDMANWYWTKFHLPTYDFDEMQARLLCVTAISRRAAKFLSSRRREMSALYKSGELPFWPFCDVFVATELARNDFAMAELAEFGDLTLYDYRPPHYEADLDFDQITGFVHPVYDTDRMLADLTQNTHSFSDVLRSNSVLRRRLKRYPLKYQVKHVFLEGRKRIARKLKRHL